MHGELVAGVGSSVDDVESGDGHHDLLDAGQVSDVLVQRNSLWGKEGKFELKAVIRRRGT